MKRIQELEGEFEGTAVILCTGPSALEHLDTIPRDAFIIGINRRSLALARKAGLDLDMMVANDPWEFDPMVSSQEFVHIPYKLGRAKLESSYFINKELWHNGLTTSTALSVASLMGFDKIIIYGLDMYSGKKCYFNNDRYDKKQDTTAWENHDLSWGSILDDVPRSHVLEMVGGHPWLNKIINEKEDDKSLINKE